MKDFKAEYEALRKDMIIYLQKLISKAPDLKYDSNARGYQLSEWRKFDSVFQYKAIFAHKYYFKNTSGEMSEIRHLTHEALLEIITDLRTLAQQANTTKQAYETILESVAD